MSTGIAQSAMFRCINNALLLCAILTGFATCSKEYSCEDCRTAAFTCLDVIVEGSFIKGSPLAATIRVTLTVQVDTIGVYSISTNELNGISFSGSGKFTNTGAQTITLTGTGTPLEAGTFTYNPEISGCPLIVTVSNREAAFTCTSAKVFGDYWVDTLLKSSNKVALQLQVFDTGAYYISTDTINGVVFSGSGTFTSTGQKSITLEGSGTPKSSGTFEYNSVSGCPFSVTAASFCPYEYYYEAIIDGVQYKQTVTACNGYVVQQYNSGGDDHRFFSSLTPLGPDKMTSISIQKGIFLNFSTSTLSSFKDFFAVGTYPYAQKLPNSLIEGDGVVVHWTESWSSPVHWSTSNPPGSQTGSVFAITSVQDTPSAVGHWIDVSGTFKCKFYNTSGQVKNASDGKFKIKFFYR